MRSHSAATADPANVPARIFVVEDEHSIVGTHQVWRAGTAMDLTATESRPLHLFLVNPKRVLSKPQILDHGWPYGLDAGSNMLEANASYLRRRLDKYCEPLLHAVRLVSYVLLGWVGR